MIGAYTSSVSDVSTRRSIRAERLYHDTKNAIRGRDHRVTCPSVLRGKQFGRDGVKNPVHDITRKTIRAIPPKERIGCAGRC
jgi:hypothetical protein